MAVATRTDIHAPTQIQVAEYDYAGSLDWQGSGSAAEWRVELINRVVVAPGRQWSGVHGSSRCDHCGAHLRYAALMIHRPTNTVIEIGETCLDNRFPLASADFQRMRKAAQRAKGQGRVALALRAFEDRYPHLAFLATGELPEMLAGDSFVQSISGQLVAKGTLSTAQIDAMERKLDRAQALQYQREMDKLDYEKRKAQQVQPVRAAESIIEGRYLITGEVVSLKYVDNQFTGGSDYKMLVLTDAQNKVYGNVPSGFDPKRGDRVQFTATVTRSRTDPLFGIFKIAKGAVVLSGSPA